VLHAEPLAGAAESRDHLIRDHEHLEVVADVANARKPPGRRDYAPAALSTGSTITAATVSGSAARIASARLSGAAAHQVFLGAGALVPKRVRSRHPGETIPSIRLVWFRLVALPPKPNIAIVPP
jgi:hypothetical protein